MAKIFGELEKAQAENVATDPVTNLVNGRMIFNTTQKKFKIYDGTLWVEASAEGVSVSTKSLDYTILDDDGIGTILVDDTSVDRIILLPTAADNANRIITVKNISTDKGQVTLDGEGSETIDFELNANLDFKKAFITVVSDGNNWSTVATNNTSIQKQYTQAAGDFTISGTNYVHTRSVAIPYKTSNGIWRIRFNSTGVFNSSSTVINLVFSGVTFKNVAGYNQSFTMWDSTANGTYLADGIPNTGNMQIFANSNQVGRKIEIAGDLELDSKPTFVE